MNVEQIYRLMRASSERCTSLKVEATERLYQKTADGEAVYQQANAVTHWTPFIQHCRIEKRMLNVPPEQPRDLRHVETCLVGRHTSKELLYTPEPERRIPLQGRIVRTTRALKAQIAAYSPYWTAWHYNFDDWIEITQIMNEYTVKRNSENGLYVLERNLSDDQRHIRFHSAVLIDPQKDYLPVRETSVFTEDGKSYVSTKEWSDFQKINGLWLPAKYTSFHEDSQKGGEYTYHSIHVNEPIAEDALKLDFPYGTVVKGRLLGIQYRVGMDHLEILKTNDHTITTVPLARAPVIEAELAQAAAKAPRMTDEPAAGNEKRFEVYPNFIWVEKGKKDYAISIETEAADKPVLRSHILNGGGLILHDVTDQIAAEERIIVSIERPDTLTGYAHGNLELEFDSHKTVIELIAAPMSN